jgi:hypothetical protein
MAEGELGAAFRALAREAAEAMERAADGMAATAESTAATAEAAGKDLAQTDATAGRRFDDIRKGHATGKGPEGVPGTPPQFGDVEIDSTKIAGYAMNPEHPVGRNKYRVIHSATGLDTSDVAAIEQQIRDGVRASVPIEGKADQYGQRWAVDVPLAGPEGSITVRTAWILDAGSTTPRLVTVSFP